MGCAASDAKAPQTAAGAGDGRFNKEDLIREKKDDFFAAYQLDKRLGCGTYGEVWAVTHKVTKNERAVKIVKKSLVHDNDKLFTMFHTELDALSKIVLLFLRKTLGQPQCDEDIRDLRGHPQVLYRD